MSDEPEPADEPTDAGAPEGDGDSADGTGGADPSADDAGDRPGEEPGDPPGDAAGDEVLAPGRRPRLPRWVYPVAGLVLLAVALGLVVTLTRHGTTKHGSPGSRTGGSAAGSPRPGGSGTAPSTGRSSVPVPGGDVAVVGDQLFWLHAGALYRYRLAAGARPVRDGALPIEGLDALAPADSYHLLPDAARHLIWVAGFGRAPASALAVDTATLAVRDRTQWPAAVHAAAALAGHLYLVSTNAVVDVSVGAAARTVDALPGDYLAAAADPGRGRLLLLDVAEFDVVSYDPASGSSFGGQSLSVAKGDLAVTARGYVWLGGYSNAGAVLDRLDAQTLHLVATSPLTAQLGPGARVVAAGTDVIWVRAGGADDPRLWCVDATTGAVDQQWAAAPGAVTSRSGAAYVDDGRTLRPLTLNGCPG